MHNKINSSRDWLLDDHFSHCFICGVRFDEPAELIGYYNIMPVRGIHFNVVSDYLGSTVENNERVCDDCMVSDLSRFVQSNYPYYPRIKKIFIPLNSEPSSFDEIRDF